MRKIEKLFIHCSDSDLPQHDNIQVIRLWHTQRGFTGPDGVPGNEDDIGYHFVILKNGDIKLGRPIEEVGAHVKNHNARSIGICLTGRHKFSQEQFNTLSLLCKTLCESYDLTKNDIYGHRDADKKKSCPNFDVHKLKDTWEW